MEEPSRDYTNFIDDLFSNPQPLEDENSLIYEVLAKGPKPWCPRCRQPVPHMINHYYNQGKCGAKPTDEQWGGKEWIRAAIKVNGLDETIEVYGSLEVVARALGRQPRTRYWRKRY